MCNVVDQVVSPGDSSGVPPIFRVSSRDSLVAKRHEGRLRRSARTIMAKVCVLVVAGVMGLTLTTNATAQSGAGGRLVVARGGDIDKLDPHQATAAQTFQTLELVYDNLFELDQQLGIKPALATGWKYSADGTELTITLRSGIKFHDGKAFDSADVKASIERVLDEKSAAVSRPNLLSIKEVLTRGPLTVVLKLSQPDGTLPAAFTDLNTTMLSADDIKAGTIVRKPNGTGAFKWDKWVQGQSVSLVANPDYWGGKPKIAGIDQRVVGDQFSILAGLRAKEYDFGIISNPAVVRQAGQTLKVDEASSLSYWPLMMQTTKKPFTDSRVRQAVSCAINREEVISAAVLGKGKVSGPFTLPAYVGSPFDGLPCKGVDIEMSKKLLSDAGYPNGFTVTTSIISGDDPTAQNIGQSVKSQLAKVGITLNLQSMETNVYVARWLAGDFETSISPNSGRADPHLVYARFFTPSAPLFKALGYGDDTLTKLMTEGKAETNPEKRKEIYAKISRLLVGDAPMAWLFVPSQFWVMQPNVKGFLPMPNLSLRSLRAVER